MLSVHRKAAKSVSHYNVQIVLLNRKIIFQQSWLYQLMYSSPQGKLQALHHPKILLLQNQGRRYLPLSHRLESLHCNQVSLWVPCLDVLECQRALLSLCYGRYRLYLNGLYPFSDIDALNHVLLIYLTMHWTRCFIILHSKLSLTVSSLQDTQALCNDTNLLHFIQIQIVSILFNLRPPIFSQCHSLHSSEA